MLEGKYIIISNSLLRVTVGASLQGQHFLPFPASPLLFVIIKISIHRVKHR